MRSVKVLTVAILISVWSVSCTSFMTRKPWRTYDEMPFDAQKWREGDEIERGRMLRDMRNKITGKTDAEVIEMLGNPDEKLVQNGSESWLYNTEHPGRKTYYQTGVEFDRSGKARISSFDSNGVLNTAERR